MQIRKSLITHRRRVQLVEDTPESYRVTRAVLMYNEWEDLSSIAEANLDFTTAVRRFYAAIARRTMEAEANL